MHSLRMCCKILCQNLVVHPKWMLGHIPFHANSLEIGFLQPIPPPQKWKFQLRTGLRKFEVDFWKLVSDATTPSPPETPQPPTSEMEIWDFSISGLSIKSWLPTLPPPENGNFS